MRAVTTVRTCNNGSIEQVVMKNDTRTKTFLERYKNIPMVGTPKGRGYICHKVQTNDVPVNVTFSSSEVLRSCSR